jgi:O-antigen/teichoic acid export membrane protein
LTFDLDAVQGLFRFGKYIFGSSIVVFLFVQGPDALVGKILNLNSLGFYVLAFGIANTPATSITHVVSQIALPAYAKLQDDLPKLREGYLKVMRLVAFLSTPITGGIFMLIPEFVQIFLGARWAPIVLPVRILCIFGFFRSIYSTVGPVFYGTGRPDLGFKFACLNLALLAILVYPLTVTMGIVGTSIAFSSVTTISIFFVMRLVYRLIRLDAERNQFLKVLFFPLAGTILMCFSIFLLKLVFVRSLIVRFCISILVGGSCYILILYALDKYLGYGLIDTIRFAAKSFRDEGKPA